MSEGVVANRASGQPDAGPAGKKSPPPYTICVTGDHVVHWMQVMGPAGVGTQPGAGNADFLRVWSRSWGAALLEELLKQGKAALENPLWPEPVALDVMARTLPDPALEQINCKGVVRDYALWGEDDTGVCRMQKFLFRQDADNVQGESREASQSKPKNEPTVDAAHLNCLIIDDIGREFRVNPRWPSWLPDGLPEPPPKSGEGNRLEVILKTAGPLQERNPVLGVHPLIGSTLWKVLVARQDNDLTVYCKVDSLRQANFAPIGLPLSWERTANDVVKAVANSELVKAKRVVVSLGLAGAVVIARGEDPILIFDENNQEGDFERKFDGLPIGLGRYIVAAMAIAGAQAKARDPEQTSPGRPQCDDVPPHWSVVGVQRGLNAARSVHEDGFGSRQVRPSFAGTRAVRWICGDQHMGKNPFYQQRIGLDDNWRLLGPASNASYFQRAREWVAKGDVTGDPFPIEKMGGWMSVDRDEIESIRSIKNIVREYLAKPYKSDKPPAPLNLAVFGQPGSGKSYAVKQMIEEMEDEKGGGGPAVDFHLFNLAQFAAVSDLPDMLHEVRDIALGGKTPVVFWDEFDTTVEGRKLGWLAPFLQPMQDGLFLDGGKERPIGRAVFIFAGGVFHTMADFRAHAVASAHDGGTLPGHDRGAAAPPAKATDFLSRLRGYVDILGPNPVHTPGRSDATYMLRRALLLRSLLQREAPHLVEKRDDKDYLQIDGGVLNAFLSIDEYSHGSRSMEALIAMSALSGKKSFEQSSLPAMHQINLHVDAERFLRLVETTPSTSAADSA